MEDIDLLICPRWLVPVEPAGLTLEHHAVAVRGGRIAAVLPREEARKRFRPAETVELPEHVLLPGFVNLHAHAAMSLFRGMADDLPLMRWLQEAIWPAEGRFVSESFVEDGSLLAAAEMLRGGITTCNDMYFHPDAAARAFDRLGLRAVLGITVLDFPTPYAADADEYLRRGLEAREKWAGHPLLSFSLAPHAPYTVSDETFRRVRTLAAELDAPIHLHVHETREEIEESLRQHGCRPLERLARLQLLGPGTTCVHSVHLDAAEIALLAATGSAVAHCPTSNMKLASGIAPTHALDQAGVCVGLGSDGCASNNRLDILQEMRHAALLGKAASGDASALPASRVLRMATLDGAQALGMEKEIGSIEAGKQADLCAIELGSPFCQPCFDPTSHVVYVAGREQISHVWISGEARLAAGNLLQIGHNELLAITALWHTKLVS